MIGPKYHLRASLAAAGILLAGCGGSGPAGGGPGGTSTAGTTTAPPKITHADPQTLLPTAGEVSSTIRPLSSPGRHDQTLSFSTLSSAFASQVPRAIRLASGTAELDVIGPSQTFLYVHVFVFRSLSGAESLTPAFLKATRLRTGLSSPSGAPGQQGEGSSQSYGRRQVSYRYAFRESNVLSYVELDGPGSRYSLAQAVRVAAAVDGHIRATLS